MQRTGYIYIGSTFLLALLLGACSNDVVGTEADRVLEIGGSFSFQHVDYDEQGFELGTIFEHVEVVDYVGSYRGKEAVAHMTRTRRNIGIVTQEPDLYVKYEANGDRSDFLFVAIVEGTGYYFTDWLTMPAGSKGTKNYRFDTTNVDDEGIGIDVQLRYTGEKKITVKEIEYDGAIIARDQTITLDGKVVERESSTSTYVPELGIIAEAMKTKTDSVGVVTRTETTLTSYVAPD